MDKIMSRHIPIITDLYHIDSEYTSLINDGDYDILYSGLNKYGVQVLGSILKEDEDSGVVQYIHVLLKERQYVDFLNRDTSLLKILSDNKFFFIIDKQYPQGTITANLVQLDDIPIELRPLEDSLCPAMAYRPSFLYSASMKGGGADTHSVPPEDTNEVNGVFSAFFKKAIEWTSDLGLYPVVYNEGLRAGSFKISFRIELVPSNQTSWLAVDPERVKEVLPEFFKYALNEAVKNDFTDLQPGTVKSDAFVEINEKIGKLYTDAELASGVSQWSIGQSLRDGLSAFKDIEFDRVFSRVEISSEHESGLSTPLGIVDAPYVEHVERIPPPDDGRVPEVAITDIVPQDYVIQVYDFNSETGKGSGYVFSEADSINKMSFSAKGMKSYDNTLLTFSMDQKKQIPIRGLATKVNGRIKKMTIDMPSQPAKWPRLLKPR